MKDLALIKETMSSVEIAENAEMNHKDVLRAIRTIEPAWKKITGRRFPIIRKQFK